MALFLHALTGELHDIDPDLHSHWVESGNPKAALLTRLPDPPPHDPLTHLPPVWVDGAWVIDPLPPAFRRWSGAAEFLSEFTPQEAIALRDSTNPVIARLTMILLAWPGEVWATDQRIVQGMAALVAEGILTQARHDQMLGVAGA